MRRWTIAFFIAVMLLAASGVFACPFCKDSIPTSDAQTAGGVPSGFNNTIYLMLGGLVCVLGMVTFTLIKGARTSVHANAVNSPDERSSQES